MIATLGNNTLENLKPGSVLTVTNVITEQDAQKEIADFLLLHNRHDLGYFLIAENYFMVYSKNGLSVQAVA
jgi:hypothetical protein